VPAVSYLAPRSLGEALEALGSGGFRVLAGGTDLYPALRDRPVTFPVLDIGRIAELRGIARTADGGWRIGAATTWTDVINAALPDAFDGLKAAAREVGSIQIQNAGTVGGNLCNASPAADGVPPLLTLDAAVELASVRGNRVLPLAEFVTGVRTTARQPDELLTAVLVPPQPEAACAAFRKLGSRRYLVISIAMVATLVVADATGRIADARIAVGACSPVARRLPALERTLRGQPVAAAAAQVRPEHLAPLAPIDDVRASAAYRLHAVAVLLRRALSSPPPQAERAA
jgi:CO/xanthine dehydrogenase FAD-binding subunit